MSKYNDFFDIYDGLTQGSRLAGTRSHNDTFPESANEAARLTFNYTQGLLCASERDVTRFNQLLVAEITLLGMSFDDRTRCQQIVASAIGGKLARKRSYINLKSHGERTQTVRVFLHELEPKVETEGTGRSLWSRLIRRI